MTLAVLLVLLPPVLLHVRVKVNVPAVPRVTVWEPPVLVLLPLQPVPPAVQEVGLLPVVQVTVVLLPAVMVPGDTLTLTVGTAMTVTVAEAEPDPALLLHDRV